MPGNIAKSSSKRHERFEVEIGGHRARFHVKFRQNHRRKTSSKRTKKCHVTLSGVSRKVQRTLAKQRGQFDDRPNCKCSALGIVQEHPGESPGREESAVQIPCQRTRRRKSVFERSKVTSLPDYTFSPSSRASTASSKASEIAEKSVIRVLKSDIIAEFTFSRNILEVRRVGQAKRSNDSLWSRGLNHWQGCLKDFWPTFKVFLDLTGP